MLAALVLDLSLPKKLTIGLSWLLPGVEALWYWELDRGGPSRRMLAPDARPDFYFPQLSQALADEKWLPGLIDHLYVSFTNATAFSPTDTMPLTPIAKVLMAGQALASLVTLGLVVARPVNILS